jgi:hypothetical protein
MSNFKLAARPLALVPRAAMDEAPRYAVRRTGIAAMIALPDRQ